MSRLDAQRRRPSVMLRRHVLGLAAASTAEAAFWLAIVIHAQARGGVLEASLVAVTHLAAASLAAPAFARVGGAIARRALLPRVHAVQALLAGNTDHFTDIPFDRGTESHLPVISGFDVATVLKADPTTAAVPILILSIVRDEERGYRIGVDRYFTKPADADQLADTVRDLLAGEAESP